MVATGGSGGMQGSGGSAGSGSTLEAGGAIGSGAVPGSGGVASTGGGSGGKPGSGGVVGTGGAAGAGGVKSGDGAVGLACREDGGSGLPRAARSCSQDADCTMLIQSDCCLPGAAYGVAKAQSANYISCIEQVDCGGGPCGHGPSFVTDTGRITPEIPGGSNPIDWVAVHCVSQLCTTDIAEIVDGGQDAPVRDALAAEADRDTRPPCGDAACGPGQACALIIGGAVPPCYPLGDASDCGEGLVLVASCSVGGGPTYYQPGCTPPAPSPRCYDVPDGCGDPCTCVCPSRSSWGCTTTPGYLMCPGA